MWSEGPKALGSPCTAPRGAEPLRPFSEECSPQCYAVAMESLVASDAADTEESAHRAMAAARWPDGVRCPRCRSDAVSERRGRYRPGWRCRSCRADFTATTNTPLHASKAPLSAWVGAATDDVDPAGVSDKTARGMRRVVESTGLPAGAGRLEALLTSRPDPAGSGPLEGVSAGRRKILAMLRTRAAGANPALIASETGLALPHVRRCLRALRAEGFVESDTMSVMWGYRPQRLKVWRLDMTDRTIAALPQMGWSPPPPDPPPDQRAWRVLVVVLVWDMCIAVAHPRRRDPHRRHPYRRPRPIGASLGARGAAAVGAAGVAHHARLRHR